MTKNERSFVFVVWLVKWIGITLELHNRYYKQIGNNPSEKESGKRTRNFEDLRCHFVKGDLK